MVLCLQSNYCSSVIYPGVQPICSSNSYLSNLTCLDFESLALSIWSRLCELSENSFDSSSISPIEPRTPQLFSSSSSSSSSLSSYSYKDSSSSTLNVIGISMVGILYPVLSKLEIQSSFFRYFLSNFSLSLILAYISLNFLSRISINSLLSSQAEITPTVDQCIILSVKTGRYLSIYISVR